jgi:hypothetical protein
MEFVLGAAVNHRPLEAQAGNGALQLVSRRGRIPRRQCGKGCEAFGVAVHGVVEAIIRRGGQLAGLCRVELLDRRRRMRNDLQVNARGVHFAQPQLTQVGQPGHELGHPPAAAVGPRKH